MAIATASDDSWQLTIPGATADACLMGPHPTGECLAPEVAIAPATLSGSPAIAIRVPWDYAMPVRVEDRPGGLAAVFEPIFSQTRTRSLAPGVELESFHMGTARGPLRAWAIVVAPRKARVVPLLACQMPQASASVLPGLWPVSAMASAAGAVAAVNGGYFSWADRLPVGLLQVNGRMIGGPLFGRAAIALSGGPPRIERVEVQPWIQLPDGQSAEVDFLNFPRQDDALMLYTPAWGDRTGTRPEKDAFEVALDSRGTVIGLGPSDLAIPPDGDVLAGTGAHGRWLQAHVRRGERVSLHSPLSAFWGDRPDAVGGGPILVRDGKAQVGTERFPADITTGLNARTAIGMRPDGTVLIAGVAGGVAHYSVGMSLSGLADFMVGLGASEAMNLDGGGSTTVWADGKLLNRPSDGQERAVADALAVIPTD